MKNAVLPIVIAALLASAPAAAGPRDLCTSQETAASGETAGGGCSLAVKAQLLQSAQNFLSDKELEQALRRQLNGRLIDAKLNAARVEYTVLWEEQQAGKRKLRKLIVDARTGKVKREIRGSS
jgi:uncharacterized membrane protein YkoI